MRKGRGGGRGEKGGEEVAKIEVHYLEHSVWAVNKNSAICLLNHFLYNEHVARQLFLRLLCLYLLHVWCYLRWLEHIKEHMGFDQGIGGQCLQPSNLVGWSTLYRSNSSGDYVCPRATEKEIALNQTTIVKG